jgi:hypothetical protein
MRERIVSSVGILLLLGLAANLQAIGLHPMGGNVGIGGTVAGDHMWYVKFGLTPRLAMEMSFDWTHDSESADRFWLGGGLLWHSWQGQKVRPYAGARAAIAIYDDPGSDESKSRFVLLPSAGVEYFIHDALSLGAEASLPLMFGSFSLRTTTLAAVRYYF